MTNLAPKGEAYLMAASLKMLAGMPRLARYSFPAPGGWASGSTLTTVILYITNINILVMLKCDPDHRVPTPTPLPLREGRQVEII
jgi:hypothetical protein